MEREKAFLMHREVVQPFIKDAFKEGAHRIKPRHISGKVWFRQIMIGVVYNDIGSTATVEELAEDHGTFKQSIADSNKSFLRNLWNSSSPELKERYPVNEILTARKPRSQRSREKLSLAQGGASLKIKEQVDRGVTDINTISENTGIAKNVIRTLALATLKGCGINIPREVPSYKEALKQLGEETDGKKIQELLDGLPYYAVRYDIANKKEASKFSALWKIIREGGFRLHGKYVHFFADSLSSAGVPISKKDIFLKDGSYQRYYIVLSRHRERIIQVLKEDQSLQRFQRESNGYF